MIQYSIRKTQDKYFITNEGASTINYETKKLYDCVNFLSIFDGEILAGQEVEITFTGDGEYQIVLALIGSVDVTIPIKYFLSLQLSFIESVADTICECGCGCDDCSETSKDKLCNLLMARAKIDVYKRLTNPEAVAFFDAVYGHTKCLVKKPVYCSVAEELILGAANCNEKLIKQLLALDYLALYFFEHAQVCLTDDKDYVKCKFKTEKIFCCIQSLGIDIGNIEQLINDNMGLLTINSGAYVNQPPSAVGDNTISVANRASTVITLAMVTTQTIPVYTDPENDPVADIRIDSLPADGVLELNGTPVTAGQIIPVADLNANLLVYISPNQDALDNDGINFSLRDTGSLQWSS